MPKVVPIKDKFDSVEALLASIAEHPRLKGFVGAVVLQDNTYVPVSHGVDRGDFSFAGALFLNLSQEQG